MYESILKKVIPFLEIILAPFFLIIKLIKRNKKLVLALVIKKNIFIISFSNIKINHKKKIIRMKNKLKNFLNGFI